MLYALEEKDPEYYRRFSAAMRGGASAELWPAEPGRYALKGRYLEFMGHANKTNNQERLLSLVFQC